MTATTIIKGILTNQNHHHHHYHHHHQHHHHHTISIIISTSSSSSPSPSPPPSSSSSSRHQHHYHHHHHHHHHHHQHHAAFKAVMFAHLFIDKSRPTSLQNECSASKPCKKSRNCYTSSPMQDSTLQGLLICSSQKVGKVGFLSSNTATVNALARRCQANCLILAFLHQHSKQ